MTPSSNGTRLVCVLMNLGIMITGCASPDATEAPTGFPGDKSSALDAEQWAQENGHYEVDLVLSHTPGICSNLDRCSPRVQLLRRRAESSNAEPPSIDEFLVVSELTAPAEWATAASIDWPHVHLATLSIDELDAPRSTWAIRLLNDAVEEGAEEAFHPLRWNLDTFQLVREDWWGSWDGLEIRGFGTSTRRVAVESECPSATPIASLDYALGWHHPAPNYDRLADAPDARTIESIEVRDGSFVSLLAPADQSAEPIPFADVAIYPWVESIEIEPRHCTQHIEGLELRDVPAEWGAVQIRVTARQWGGWNQMPLAAPVFVTESTDGASSASLSSEQPILVPGSLQPIRAFDILGADGDELAQCTRDYHALAGRPNELRQLSLLPAELNALKDGEPVSVEMNCGAATLGVHVRQYSDPI